MNRFLIHSRKLLYSSFFILCFTVHSSNVDYRHLSFDVPQTQAIAAPVSQTPVSQTPVPKGSVPKKGPAPKNHITDLLNTIDWPFIINQYIGSLIKSLMKPCFCNPLIFGFSQDFWSPSFISEIVADPGFSALLGVDIKMNFSPMKDSTSETDKGNDTSQDQEHSRHGHFWQFPIFQMLDIAMCGTGDGIGIMYMSELDITWTSPATASLLDPVAFLLNNILLPVAAIADCALVTVIGNNTVSDAMFFSLGCWGLTYPASGRSVYGGSMLETDLLFFGRTVAKAHMIAAVFATTTKHSGSICAPIIYPIIPKDEYLFSYVYPTMKIRNSNTKFAFGITTLIIPEIGMSIPFKEGASIYLLYKHKQCCLY